MRIEIRADGMHISGYANITEKRSRPVVTPRGRVIEIIETGAFRKTLEKPGNKTLTKDHGEQVLAELRTKTLSLCEDQIGLRYEAHITDEQTIAEARAGKIRGLSFGMTNVVDDMEERADGLPVRHVKELDLDHITLVVNKVPVYAATLLEMRADGDEDVETRADAGERVDVVSFPEKQKFDNSAYHSRLAAIRK